MKREMKSPKRQAVHLSNLDAGDTQRLNRILSSAGLTSRRKADEWIKSGRVMVNGVLVMNPGVRAVWGWDRIQVDGEEIPKPSERIYLMLNKPFGYMCSFSDPEGRPVVTDLIKDIRQRIYPIGRLDFDTLGLLLLTNDGEMTHRLTHPRYHVTRTYKVTVTGQMSSEAMAVLTKGIRLEDGPSGRSKVTLIARNEKQSIIRMTITQGRSRLVRRMLDAVGFTVVHLIRTGFGNLELQDLRIGEYRYLKGEEVAAIKKLVGLI